MADGPGRDFQESKPEYYYSVVRITNGRSWCSATIVARRLDGTAVLTTASHCFGPAPRDGIKITYHRRKGTDQTGTRRSNYVETQATAGWEIAHATGHYQPGRAGLDYATITASLPECGSPCVVGVGPAESLRSRKTYAVGCPSGTFPPVFKAGAVLAVRDDSRGTVIYSSQSIIGGQSGGALFCAETGYLIGVTNWGPMNGSNTQALAASSFKDFLRKHLPSE